MSGCCSEVTEPFALRVVGDSMAPEFQDGHIIIIDPGYQAVHGAYVVVDYGGEVIFARFVADGERRFLEFLNGDKSIELSPPYEVKGVVIQRAGRRRKDRKHYAYPKRADLSVPA